MYLKPDYFNRMVVVGAGLFPTKPRVESLLIRAQIPVEAIRLTEAGLDMWNSALGYADKKDKHLKLIEAALEEFPYEAELIEIKKAMEDNSAFITEISYDQYITPSPLPSTATTFLVYHLEDYEKNVKGLILQLKILQFPPSKIKLYDMHGNAAGMDKKKERLEQLGKADIVLLLLTSRFFGDDDCMELTVAASEMRKWVVPVLLEDCYWSRIKFFENIHPLPTNGVFVSKWNNKDEAHLEIVKGVEKVAGVVKK